ncbi:MAG: PAS domain S-box protein [Bacteroidetes bacterium]|nr:PAS domain S-box protein [Bacteroidota bacterium]
MKKILAIDDQQDNLTTLKAVIKNQIPDCIVLTALSGKEGIEIAQKEQPDTILLDIIMPKMNGYEVCRNLKNDELTKHIPIIMLTAIKTDSESRVKGLNMGADAFLAKPIDHAELTAQIKVMFRIKDAEDRLRTDKKGLKEIVKEQSFSLRESEEKYKALYENAPLPYQSLNEDGSFKDINPAWLTTLGYKKSEVIGKFYKDFLHPDSQKHFEKNFPAFKKRGYVSDVQFKIRHKDGHYLDISFEGCIGYYPDGSFRQTYCVFQDITERKLIEKTLQESETNYKNLFDQSPAGSVIVGLDKRFVKCNKAFCNFLGYNESELIGKTIAEITHPDDIEIGMAEMKQILEGKIKTVSLEKRYLHKNGSSLWGQVVISIVRDTTNKPLYFLPIIEDITERKLVEIALKVSEEKYKYLFNSIRDAILVSDKDRNIIDCNTAFTKLFGYSKNEIIGRKTLCCYESEEQFMALGKALKENFTKSTPFLYTVNYKKKNKVVFPGETGVYYLKDNDGNVSGFIGLIRDVTERKLAEQKLIAAKNEAEESELKYRSLIENTNDVVFCVDEKGEYKFTNQVFAKTFGKTPDFFVGKNFWDIYPKEEADHRFAAVKEMFRTGEVQTIEVSVPLPDRTLYYLAKANPIKDETGKIILNLTTAIDITERKQAELELAESEERFKSLHNASFGGIAIHDKGIILECNQGLSEMTGYSLDELIGMDGLLLIATEHREMAMNKIVTGYEKPYEANGLRKNGEQFPMQLEARNVPYKGKNVRTVEFRDITDRKLAEIALKNSEEKFRKAFITSPDSININRLDDGSFVTINNGFTQVMGYTEEDVIGKTYMEFNIWRNQEDRKKLIEGLKAKGIVENLEAEFCAKNGDIKNGLMSATIIEFDGTAHILSITRDTTVQKKAVEGIMQRESLLKTIFDSTADGLLVVDNKGFVTHKNSEFIQMWRIPANLHNSVDDNELIKTVLDQLIDPDQFVSKVKKLYNSKLSDRDMLYFKDGRIFERKSQPLIIEDKISGRVWSFSDISERKRSEQIQKVLYNISDTVTSSDNIEELIAKIKDHLSGIIDTTNYYIGLYDDRTKMISLPFVADEKDEIESFPAENSLTGHVIKTQKSLLVTAYQQEEMMKKGIIKYVGSRSQVWLGVPLTIDGEVKGVLAVQSYSDKNAYNESDRQLLEFVSDQIGLSIERKQKEQELISALEKATESDRLKSAFLATMSHELRTPLNAIIGFSDIIKEDLPINEIIEFNHTINSSGNHLLTIVEDLFDITLIETGELKIIKTDVNLDALLNEVKEIIKIEQLNLKKADLELNLTIPGSKKQLNVKTDPWRLKQILINLLKNALKFTHKGSVNFGFTLNMDSEPQVTERSRSTELKFFVRDTGIGIPKDKQELIFDVFRQIEDSHTRTYGGTGIGLSISRRLTELLGGRMWVDSDTNGSSFYFTIPLELIIDQDKPGIKAELSSASIKDNTILVVEDDESSFEFLKVILKKTTQFILWAPNGEEAIRHCKNNPAIDLVLMDINMPVMNGYDATKAIKEFRPNLPIIAQTAYAIAGDREKSLAAGCDDYISKPIKRDELLDKIKKLLSS